MKTIMATSAAALLALMSSSATAKQEMVVTAQSPDVQTWVASVSNQLDRQLAARSRPTMFEPVANGIVQLRFRRGEDGRSADVRIVRQSGGSSAARQATYSVKALRNMPALPESHAGSHEILANVLIARNERELARLTDKLAGWERERLASSAGKDRVLALNTIRSK